MTERVTRPYKFFKTTYCFVLIVIIGALFAVGAICSMWHQFSKSAVSDGNVFGYSTFVVGDNKMADDYKIGDKVVVCAKNLSKLKEDTVIVYSSSNADTANYSIGKFFSYDKENYKFYYTDNNSITEFNETASNNYVGIVCSKSGFWYNIIELLNSNIMFWLFTVTFGIIFVMMAVIRYRVIKTNY